MIRVVIILSLCLIAGSARANDGETDTDSAFLDGGSGPLIRMSDQSPSATPQKDRAALERARNLCWMHTYSLNTLLGCVNITRLCNRTYEVAWREPCFAIDKLWEESDYEEQAARERKDQDQRDLEFVRGVVRESRP
jgi:hypothetical protein